MKKFSWLLIPLFGCYSPKLADKQLARVKEKHPEKLANVCRVTYPLLPVKSDTVISIEYDFIEVVDTVERTKTDTITQTKIVNKVQNIPGKVQVITKTVQITDYVKDSTDAILFESELNKLKNDVKSAQDKKKSLGIWIKFLLGFILALILFILRKK